jgi:hypothetical protein
MQVLSSEVRERLGMLSLSSKMEKDGENIHLILERDVEVRYENSLWDEYLLFIGRLLHCYLGQQITLVNTHEMFVFQYFPKLPAMMKTI